MNYKYPTIIDFSTYDTQNLCRGIDLRRHVAADLEEVGAFRVQEDWRRLVRPLEKKPYKAGLTPDFSFITVAVPECLPDRPEITSQAPQFNFTHDDVIDESIHDASLNEMEHVFEKVGQTGRISLKGASGKRRIAAHIIREMIATDPEREMLVAKSWTATIQHSSASTWDTYKSPTPTNDLSILDQACLIGTNFILLSRLWQGLVTFSCAVTISEEDADQTRELIMTAVITASLVNDLFSFVKEREESNVQNAVFVIIKEHGCSEEEPKEICRERIRGENAKYVRVVKDTRTRTDLCDDVKRYIEFMQYTLSNLPELSDNVVLHLYRYPTSLPSKGFRDQTLDSLNTWLNVPPKSAKMIKNVVKMLHSASRMLDDLQDGSSLRRDKPSTHSTYGTAQTINIATCQYTQATGAAAELSNPSCFRIYIEEMQQLVGQSYDLYWTHNALCPSISEDLKMFDKKTSGLPRMLTRMMVAESPVSENVSDDDPNLLSCLLGRFFQIRDDYQNLAWADCAKQKGFAEDLDEGKYSFTLIHCIRALEAGLKFAGDAMQLRAFGRKAQQMRPSERSWR